MPVEIVPCEADHVPAVEAFLARLRTGGVDVSLPQGATSPTPRDGDSGPGTELFVAVEGSAVRGAYILKHQDFMLDGETVSIGNFGLPVSEGTVDRQYALVASQLLLHALRRQPMLYGLGIGGYEEAAARLLHSARFSIVTVPFHFRVRHAARFLREARALRTTRARRLACDVAAATGAGAAGIALLQGVRSRRPGGQPADAAAFDAFGPAADQLWLAAGRSMRLGAVRDHAVLARLYDTPRNRFLKVRIGPPDRLLGWAVCLATTMSDAKYFGDLRVGSIVDCLAIPGHERAVVDAAVHRLEAEDVDLIVTNQSLRRFGDALGAAGFLRGPSNFLFAASPRLAGPLQPLEASLGQIHLTRGDGDGPINL